MTIRVDAETVEPLGERPTKPLLMRTFCAVGTQEAEGATSHEYIHGAAEAGRQLRIITNAIKSVTIWR